MSNAIETPVVFECAGDRLIGIVHLPERTSASVGVLVVVGGPQYRVGSHRQFVLMARALAASGSAVMRFDYRGMGDSEGEVRDFSAAALDIRAAVDTFLACAPALTGVVLWGLCDAASAALMYCGTDSRVKGLALANPWVRTQAGEAQAYIKHYYSRRLLQKAFWKKLLRGQFAVLESVRDVLRKFIAAKSTKKAAGASFIERMHAGFSNFDEPLLMLISDKDLTAAEFMDLCGRNPSWGGQLTRSNVRLVKLKNADHTFSIPGSLHTSVELTRDWLRTLQPSSTST